MHLAATCDDNLAYREETVLKHGLEVTAQLAADFIATLGSPFEPSSRYGIRYWAPFWL